MENYYVCVSQKYSMRVIFSSSIAGDCKLCGLHRSIDISNIRFGHYQNDFTLKISNGSLFELLDIIIKSLKIWTQGVKLMHPWPRKNEYEGGEAL